MQSYSSIGAPGRRRGTAHDDIDRSFYAVGQTLASIVNDPRAAAQQGGFWGLGGGPEEPSAPPPLDPSRYPPVSRADVQRYLDVAAAAAQRFAADRQSLAAFDAQHSSSHSSAELQRGGSGIGSSSADGGQQQQQGQPFMVAVAAVPTNFFQEDFTDGWDEFFQQYCQQQSADELYEAIDQLNRNLDVVELQLLREVAGRSASFFQAAATLHTLQRDLSNTVAAIRSLRKALAEADTAMYSTAVSVKGLQARRDNLAATLEISKGLEEVMAAQAALDCMLEAGDYAGALDLLEQLRGLLQQPGLMGLQCIRHLAPRLLDVQAAVDGALSGDFLVKVANGDVARLAAQAAHDAAAQPDASITGPDGSLASGAVWQLPPEQPAAAAAAAAGGSTDLEALQDQLLPLVAGLYRSDRLYSTLQQYKQDAGEEVKAAVRRVVQAVLPALLAASSGDGLPPTERQLQHHQQQLLGAGGGEAHALEQLQLLHHGSFMVLLYAAARAIFSCIHHALAIGRLLDAVLHSIEAPPSACSAAAKACGVAVQVAADVGLGRWVKLLNARASAHARLRQYELKQLLDLSEQVAARVEAVGARPLSSFRVALQGQCKALLDHTHGRCMQQLQGLLEAEQWVAVDVPAGFQAIVDRLLARCADGAALLDGAGDAAAELPGSRRAAAAPGTAAAAAGADQPALQPAGDRPVLVLCGKSFHLVNAALMLLKMLDEYHALFELMPGFGPELVHRQLELLKLFNGQTAALVLGAGAMRTAGLRSISAKQLALSCQCVGMLSTLLVPLRAGCLALVSQPRRALLLPEFDRLLQDLTIHVDEVHSKLVDIMRDRLAAAMQALPAEVRAAAADRAAAAAEAAGAPSGGSSPLGGEGGGQEAAAAGSLPLPTPTISLLAKQLGTLRGVLVPLLLREEVEFVFGAVSRAYSDALSDTFEALLAEPNSGWEPIVQASALAMLTAFRELPLDPARAKNYSHRLTTTYSKHFGLPPWDQERLGGRQQVAAGAAAAAAVTAAAAAAAADDAPGGGMSATSSGMSDVLAIHHQRSLPAATEGEQQGLNASTSGSGGAMLAGAGQAAVAVEQANGVSGLQQQIGPPAPPSLPAVDAQHAAVEQQVQQASDQQGQLQQLQQHPSGGLQGLSDEPLQVAAAQGSQQEQQQEQQQHAPGDPGDPAAGAAPPAASAGDLLDVAAASSTLSLHQPNSSSDQQQQQQPPDSHDQLPVGAGVQPQQLSGQQQQDDCQLPQPPQPPPPLPESSEPPAAVLLAPAATSDSLPPSAFEAAAAAGALQQIGSSSSSALPEPEASAAAAVGSSDATQRSPPEPSSTSSQLDALWAAPEPADGGGGSGGLQQPPAAPVPAPLDVLDLLAAEQELLLQDAGASTEQQQQVYPQHHQPQQPQQQPQLDMLVSDDGSLPPRADHADGRQELPPVGELLPATAAAPSAPSEHDVQAAAPAPPQPAVPAVDSFDPLGALLDGPPSAGAVEGLLLPATTSGATPAEMPPQPER